MHPLDYQPPSPKKPLRFLPVGLAILLALFVLNAVLIPSGKRSRETSNRVVSASNLRQIGQAILMYSNENHGAYPPDLSTLLVTEDITADVFVSPLSSDTRAEGPTTRAVVDQLSKPGHCTYRYLGCGCNSKTVPDAAIVAYEPPTDVNPGGNVLFGDGHVEWFDATWFTKLHKALATRPPASTRPVVLPAQ